MPSTHLLLEGVAPDEVTAAFLADAMDAAEAHGLALDGISVLERDGDGSRSDVEN